MRGRVYVKVEDLYGTVLCRRDITSTPELLRGGAVYKVLNTNKLVMRNVKRLFIEAWGEDLPYTDIECCANNTELDARQTEMMLLIFYCVPHVLVHRNRGCLFGLTLKTDSFVYK